MIHRVTTAAVFLAIAALLIVSPASAQEPVLPIPISSEQAYDATELQVDPPGDDRLIALEYATPDGRGRIELVAAPTPQTA